MSEAQKRRCLEPEQKEAIIASRSNTPSAGEHRAWAMKEFGISEATYYRIFKSLEATGENRKQRRPLVCIRFERVMTIEGPKTFRKPL